MKQSVHFVLTLVLCLVLSLSGVLVGISAAWAADTGIWTAVNTGLEGTGGDVRCLVIDPHSPAILYAATMAGVFRSTDSGTTWTAVNAGLTTQYVTCLVIDPVTPSALYAGTSSSLWYPEGGGVFRSTDSGTTWTAVNAGLTDPYSHCLAIDPVISSTLYTATSGGVFRSTDSGTTWTAVNNEYVAALAINPLTSSTLYAGTWGYYSTWGYGVFRSTDSGTTWAAVNSGLPGLSNVNCLVIDPHTPAILYAGNDGAGVFRYVGASPCTLTATAMPSADGSIRRSPDAASYTPATVVTLSATPAPGYTFTSWSGDLSGSTNPTTITMDSDKTVTALFTALPTCTLTPSAGSGGTIAPNTMQTVPQGGGKTFTITPGAGYHIADVVVDGSSVGAVTSYTFTNVEANHTIQAVFAIDVKRVITLTIGKSTMYVDGSPVVLEAAPIILNSRTLLPIRAVVEAVGGSITWEASTQKVTIVRDDKTVELWIGKNVAQLNGQPVNVDSDSRVVPIIMSGRTLLPLRFVAEALALDVQWNATTKAITITHAP